LRKAIEECNAGTFRRPSSKPPNPLSSEDIETGDSKNGSADSRDELNSLDSALDTEAETTDDEAQRDLIR
jgi:hypothetical protein